jgi:16S rRNA (guanine1516-N2)-methyltransferase
MSRYHLFHTDSGYQLTDPSNRRHPLTIDFNSAALQYRQARGGKRELLLKAVAVQPDRCVVDCTAGLGVDSWLMAAAGCTVILLERSPVLALMLSDALQRGRQNPEIAAVAERMTLVATDAAHWLANVPAVVDTVYIDQMFPHQKKSAAVKGGMQVLQRFLGEDGSVTDLLQAALATRCRRVVVKRPLVGGESDGLLPDYQLTAKASRFDIYLAQGL